MPRHLSLQLILILLLLAGVAQAKLPADKDLPTNDQFVQKLLPLLKATGSDIYSKTGHRDPKWDEAAVRFLDDCDLENFRATSAPSLQDLLPRGKELLDLGCHDPLVLFDYSRILKGLGFSYADPLFRAGNTIAKFGYPPLRQAWVYRRVGVNLAGDHGRDGMKKFMSVLPAVLDDPALRQDRRVLSQILSNLLQELDRDDCRRIASLTDGRPGFDPVVAKQLDALAHIREGWAARGGGWANTVTPEGWKALAEHHAQARKLLTEAWQADPTIPEIPAAMLSVCLTDGNRGEERLWLERTLKARFDYLPAYGSILNSLLPRWGGSREQLIDFGMECYQTGRYDTEVPLMLITALYSTLADDYGDTTPWGAPGIFEAVSDCLNQLASHKNHAIRADSYRSTLAAFAARIGRWPEARKQLEMLGDHVDLSSIHALKFQPDSLRGRVYAYTGPQAKTALAASKAYIDGQFDEAVRLYTQAAKGQQDNLHATNFLYSAAQAIRWQQEFDAGKSVALSADLDLTGWETIAGQWSVDEGALVCQVVEPSAVAHLDCLVNVGENYEFQADVQVAKAATSKSSAGLFMPGNYGYQLFFIDAAPKERRLTIQGPTSRKEIGCPMDADGPFRLVVQRVNGVVNVLIDGRPVVIQYPLPEHHAMTVDRIGIGSHLAGIGSVLRYSDIRIRKLPPAGLPRVPEPWAAPKVGIPPLGLDPGDKLKALEAAAPADGPARFALAHAWEAFAKTAPEKQKLLALHRAAMWYALALPDLKDESVIVAAEQLKLIPETADWDAIAKQAKQASVKSGTVGGNGARVFDDHPEQTGILVGINTCRGNYSGHPIIRAIQPIYLTPAGRVPGQWHGKKNNEVVRIEAFKGYAVGGIIARGAQRVDGFKIVFMRVKDGILDPADAYESAWVGGEGGGPVTQLGNAFPAVSLYGRAGDDLDCFGIVQPRQPSE